VHSFLSSNPSDDGQLIQDIQNDKAKGGGFYKKCHDTTQTQLCFTVFFKRAAIGVLNFESTIRKGIGENDTTYLMKIRSALENYIQLIYESTDKYWLTRQNQIYQNLHELQNLIGGINFPDDYRNIIKDYIDQKNIRESNQMVPLSRLIGFRENYLEAYRNDLVATNTNPSYINEIIEEYSKACTISISDESISMEAYKVDMIEVIYKNMLDNFKNYSLSNRGRFNVYLRKSKDILGFHSRSSEPFPDCVHNKLLQTPIWQEHRGRYSYGMFIVGMLARQLNGFAYAENLEDSNRGALRVEIPIKDGLCR